MRKLLKKSWMVSTTYIHIWFETYIPLEFACMEADDCNGRGTCNILVNNCDCDPGWTGYFDCTYCKLINVSKNESQSHCFKLWLKITYFSETFPFFPITDKPYISAYFNGTKFVPVNILTSKENQFLNNGIISNDM